MDSPEYEALLNNYEVAFFNWKMQISGTKAKIDMYYRMVAAMNKRDEYLRRHTGIKFRGR